MRNVAGLLVLILLTLLVAQKLGGWREPFDGPVTAPPGPGTATALAGQVDATGTNESAPSETDLGECLQPFPNLRRLPPIPRRK